MHKDWRPPPPDAGPHCDRVTGREYDPLTRLYRSTGQIVGRFSDGEWRTDNFGRATWYPLFALDIERDLAL